MEPKDKLEFLNQPQPNGPDKKIVIDSQGVKHYPEGTLFTKLKFTKSEETGRLIGFVSHNAKTGRVMGVRKNSDRLKQICIVDASIADVIIPETLYDVAIVPMFGKKGFIVIDATPHQFVGRVEMHYVPRISYMVVAIFGNQTIIFDPAETQRPQFSDLNLVLKVLRKVQNVRNISHIVADFTEAAHEMIKRYNKDVFLGTISETPPSSPSKESGY